MSNDTATHPAHFIDVLGRTGATRITGITITEAKYAPRVLVEFTVEGDYTVHLTCKPHSASSRKPAEITGITVKDRDGRTVAANLHKPDAAFVPASEVHHIAEMFGAVIAD